MPTKAIVAAPADEPGQGFDTHHPLADVVSRLHRAHGGKPFTGIGRIGCAGCWETAIRNDERVATEYDLPALQIDPDYVDEIAVEQACTGKRPALTVQERAVALARLLDAGLTRSQVARRLGMATRDVPRGWVRRKESGRSLRLLTCQLMGVTR